MKMAVSISFRSGLIRGVNSIRSRTWVWISIPGAISVRVSPYGRSSNPARSVT